MGRPAVASVTAVAPVRSVGLRFWHMAAVGSIAALALLMLLPHILHGGFYSDDWGYASDYAYGSSPRYPAMVSKLSFLWGGRPLLAVALPVPYAVFGVHPAVAHLVLAAVLATTVALCFYGVLVVLGVPVLESTLLALLALAFPWSDSTRLWPSAAVNNVAVIFFLLGLMLALRGLRRSDVRGLLVHAVAVALFVASVLTYEVAAGAAFLAGGLYFSRTNRRRAVILWSIDACVVTGALLYEWVATAGARGVPGFSARITQLREFLRESTWLVARTLYPDAASKAGRDAILLAILVVVVAATRRASHDDLLRRWLLMTALGVITVISTVVIVEGSALLPLSMGTGNRGNIFAALGYVAFAFGILRLGPLLLLRRRPEVARALSVLTALFLVGWYAHIVRGDVRVWDRAAARQAEILHSLRRAVPEPRHGTTIYLYGAPRELAPGIPVFTADWDFNGAVKLLYRDGSLRAFPAPPKGLRCDRSGVPRPLGLKFDTPDEARYGHVLAFDAATGQTAAVRDAASCRRINRRFANAS